MWNGWGGSFSPMSVSLVATALLRPLLLSKKAKKMYCMRNDDF
jgi:hypothetical protein